MRASNRVGGRRKQMTSQILSTATRYLLPLLLLFSFFLLLRGHNEPGGGFVGGLVAAAAFGLYALSYGVEDARRALRVPPLLIGSFGLLISVGSGVIPLAMGQEFLTGSWMAGLTPVLGKLGTPLLFDVGVYLTVFGVVSTIIFTLAEE